MFRKYEGKSVHYLRGGAKRAAVIVKKSADIARKHAPGQTNESGQYSGRRSIETALLWAKSNNIEVEKTSGGYLPEIMMDSFQMQQVFSKYYC